MYTFSQIKKFVYHPDGFRALGIGYGFLTAPKDILL
jgi:hypothetical protein